MVFNLLHVAVREALKERGIEEPTEPQAKAIPEILEGNNVLIIAPTGSGKTEAAMLPILSKMLEQGTENAGIYVLYITPLRALNRDLLDRIRWWGERLGFRVDVRHGDTDKADRQRQSKTPPHILITTPEMLQAVMTGRRLLGHLKEVRWVVVDEVHELAEDKRGVQLSLALERLRYHVGRDFQIVGLSATVGSPVEVAKFLMGVGRPFKIVMVNVVRNMQLDVVRPWPSEEDVKLAESSGLFPDVVARLRLIKKLVEENRSTLIFVNTRSMAELLGFRLSYLFPDLPVAVHHSSLSKMVRVSVEERLKKGDLKAVVATSSLELGIDIGHIDLVIQYISPHQVTRLLQRVGRSGHRLTAVPKGVIIGEDINDVMEAAVVVKLAKNGFIEPTQIPYKPYDVLVNQIVAFLLLKPRWRLEELYEIIKRAYPYRDLTIEELRRVVKFMQDLYPRLATYFEDSDTVARPRGRGFYRYFYETLSMIPDERQYAVINSKTGELVGALDESFIAEYGNPGVKFIFRGRPWLITEVDDRSIKVVEVSDPSGAIPSWIGEEIPVPYEVAQEVGRLRRRVREGATPEEIAREYHVNEETAKHVVEEIKKHEGPLPDDKTVVVEQFRENVVIVHAAFGTLVNRTLGKLLGELLIRLLEKPVGVHQDPYGIIIQTSEALAAELVTEQLEKLAWMEVREIAELIKTALVKSGSFKRRLLHVAKRMGAVDKEADVYSVSMSKLVEAFSGTPVFDEALREALERDLDLSHTVEVLQRIKAREVKILYSPQPTYLGEVLYEKLSHRLEIIPPERLRRLVLDSTKARLLNYTMLGVCLECGWYGLVRVGEVYELRCPKCGGENIGVVRVVRSDNLEREVRRNYEEVKKTAEILRRYGWLGLYVLASRLPLEAVQEVLAQLDGADINAVTERIQELEKEYLKQRLLD
ncbi:MULTISPECIES: DEAD/DEAH box helicase [Pyrobaculum]|uniref:ATP dependent helicase, Lhr family n=2 Tax=Pyrobaculum arsenaticum TaxID=121277 RepID=A4WL52_PYRAR|nr:DEAD/DEAH box helicase [Pyrobaculum arsenaticum]ABP51119.1 ATP dependent helicase, Lhr family [Pyrobaculum arsenaticum DSM 13514]MCY0891644.1 DEAD/DEAH box helicase [Pyrobaculum arsenaticum]NYR15157.1 DEAD/DEAH box helicase [Pyrobaculum arsenaticum]